MNNKILISGTGRCGTTFLIKIFSFLGFDTGYTYENYNKFISKNCNSGMEKNINDKNYVLKNPTFIENIEQIIKLINIDYMIIPIRDYNISAQSRVNNKKQNGGLWKASNKNEQILFYNKIIANYILYMTKYNINTIFIDFDKMIKDKKYLYDKLNVIMNKHSITYELFSDWYDIANKSSTPK